MKVIGIAIVVAGGVAVIVSQFLTYDSVSDNSIWQQTTRYPIILTAVAAIAVALAVVSLIIKRWLLLGLAAVISAFLLGETFPVGAVEYDAYEVGFWVLVGGALLMTAGAVLAAADSVNLQLKLERRAGIGSAAHFVGHPDTGAVAPAPSDPVSPRPQEVLSERQPADVGRATEHGSRAATGAATGDLPPAGWYPDPAGAARERYWSGQAWLNDVRG